MKHACGHNCVPKDFDIMYKRLVKYQEEFGDGMVTKNYDDRQLGGWVRNIDEPTYIGRE